MTDGRSDDNLLCFASPDGIRDVVLEDDGRVAYAYLRESKRICADVWLYNVGASPLKADWEESSEPPFRNPAFLAHDNHLPRLSSKSLVECIWSAQGVAVSVDGVVWAKLEVGSKPGWSRLARRDGPLAKVLVPLPET